MLPPSRSVYGAVRLLLLAAASVIIPTASIAAPHLASQDAALVRALQTQAPPYRVVAIFSVAALGDVELAHPSGQVALARHRDGILADLALPQKAIRRTFGSVAALALSLTAAELDAVSQHPQIERLGLDPSGRGALSDSHLVTRALEVQALGFTGSDVTVAVLDSGLDLNHADVNDDVVSEACFCAPNCCPNGASTQIGTGSSQDDHGHGTHVTGIIASNGQTSPLGTAPDVTLFPVKVLDRQNRFQSLSDIVAGLDHLVTAGIPVDVVNMSLGTSAAYGSTCDNAGSTNAALSQAVANLNATGTVVVASTGNEVNDSGIASPSCISSVLGVVATYDIDRGSNNFGSCNDPIADPSRVACFSNVSPDATIAAPGHLIRSSRLGGGDVSMFGTSMASPQVAGCAALLKSANPSLSAVAIRDALVASPEQATDNSTGLTFPRLDCRDAATHLGLDVEPEVDAGAPVVDAGAPEIDAGDPEVDAGAPVVDGGGLPNTDAGAGADDGGANVDDAGAAEPEPTPEPDAQPTPSPDNTPTPDAQPTPAPDNAPAEPSAVPEATFVPEAEPGPGECGCDSTSAPPGSAFAGLALVALSLLRRRRHATRGRRQLS